MHLALIIVYKFVVTRCGRRRNNKGEQGPRVEGKRRGRGRGEEDPTVKRKDGEGKDREESLC